jgi:hypothetical protein
VPGYQPYIRGQQQDVWIKWPANNNPQFWESGNQNMLGYVWPEGKTVFPDFFLNRTIAWWSNEVKLFYNTIKFDGLWIGNKTKNKNHFFSIKFQIFYCFKNSIVQIKN